MTDAPLSARLPAPLYAEVFHAAPVALLVIRADGLIMAEVNGLYLDLVGMTQDRLIGHHVFDVFPDSPLREADQQLDLRELLQRTITQRKTQVVESMRYDIPGGEGFDPRWWNVVEVPVLDEDGAVEWMLHYTEDVTDLISAQEALGDSRRASEAATRQVSNLAEIALALTAVETLGELEDIIVGRGLDVVGAHGGSVVSRTEGGWRNTVSDTLGDHVQEAFAVVAYDDPLPGPACSRTGERILLPTRTSGLAFHPRMAEVYEATGCDGWAVMPLTIRGRRLGALAMCWTEEQEFTDDTLELLEALAAQCAQTLSRIESAEEQRRTTRRLQALAEALQEAMLTPPPQPDDLDIEVRYRTAGDVAQVGGDWYDAFQQPDGSTMLVIGDVSGHDNVAAGKMGQLRGLLRALAYDAEDRPHGDTPAAILTRFEYAARGLAVDELATAILARVELVDDGSPGGVRRVVRWSNAGNPPPVLLEANGVTTLLEPRSDLLLGVDPTTDRHDHVVDLPDGATLVLYTDGLVERREASIEDGLGDLRRSLADLAEVPLGELCDTVLGRLAPHTGEDDIALLVLRARPSTRSAPSAG